MQPTSIERTPRACKADTAAITCSLVSKKEPTPSTLIVQGHALTRRVTGSSRPLSTREMAGSKAAGMRGPRWAAAMAVSQASYGVPGAGGPNGSAMGARTA